MRKTRWPVVLFDLDGTLANSIDLVVASYTHAFASVTGRAITREQAKRWIGETLAQTFAREDPTHAAALQDAYRARFNNHMDQIGGYPGLPQLLADLRAAGATLGVVTSKRHDAALGTMRQAGVEGLIELVGCMEDTAAHKPDPEPLLAAAAKLGVDPNSCAYVGDAVYDVKASRAAGMASVIVTWGAGERQELSALKPDALCDDVESLRDVLMPVR